MLLITVMVVLAIILGQKLSVPPSCSTACCGRDTLSAMVAGCTACIDYTNKDASAYCVRTADTVYILKSTCSSNHYSAGECRQ
ncbi:unnamed protein product [Adineta steineri]|uniref:Uncharacterized protein n=1 Tax=Adineta steineri TaxID=433720 RepID=A0A814E533_9BILA|nr:unnamed protein product [Adineta steineri]CAF0962673.1 unnamed protein product [Adineta steineri]